MKVISYKGKPDVQMGVLEAASFLGVDRKTIWEHATKRKTLPIHIRKANGRKYFYKSELETWAQA